MRPFPDEREYRDICGKSRVEETFRQTRRLKSSISCPLRAVKKVNQHYEHAWIDFEC